jgi:ribosome-associated protein
MKTASIKNLPDFIGIFGLMLEIIKEIKFKTARSGGKGGQHVNKVETMVEGYWNVEQSSLISDDNKKVLLEKLANKINASGFLIIKSQTFRTQLANKEEVVKKFQSTIKKALYVPKVRKATKATKASKEKRLASKKINSDKKIIRKKVTSNEQ